MPDGGTSIPQRSAPDTVTRRVDTLLHRAAARAYAYPRPHDEGHDPELCNGCQRTRPTTGSDLCHHCTEGGLA